jgi:hypothetical protein
MPRNVREARDVGGTFSGTVYRNTFNSFGQVSERRARDKKMARLKELTKPKRYLF